MKLCYCDLVRGVILLGFGAYFIFPQVAAFIPMVNTNMLLGLFFVYLGVRKLFKQACPLQGMCCSRK